MRVGFNPHKTKYRKVDYFHQVIIPVYIPNQEGILSDSFEILMLCFDSLSKPFTIKHILLLSITEVV
jgi:hypothetical protein